MPLTMSAAAIRRRRVRSRAGWRCLPRRFPFRRHGVIATWNIHCARSAGQAPSHTAPRRSAWPRPTATRDLLFVYPVMRLAGAAPAPERTAGPGETWGTTPAPSVACRLLDQRELLDQRGQRLRCDGACRFGFPRSRSSDQQGRGHGYSNSKFSHPPSICLLLNRGAEERIAPKPRAAKRRDTWLRDGGPQGARALDRQIARAEPAIHDEVHSARAHEMPTLNGWRRVPRGHPRHVDDAAPHEIGLMGSMACLLVLLGFMPEPASLSEYARLRAAMGGIAQWIFLPSLALTLIAGLAAIALNQSYHNAGWAWAKLLTGVLISSSAFRRFRARWRT